MNVVVTAGGVLQPKDPLYPVNQGGYKAMIEIAGKPMVQWVLDALNASEQIENIVVVGLPPATLLESSKPLYLIEDQGDMLSNIQAGARHLDLIAPDETHALLASADVPALTAEMVDWLISEIHELDQDIYYVVIDRATMESVFPQSKRTYLRLKEVELCGGDLHCFRVKFAAAESPLWKRLIDARKSPLRQASILGYDTLFILLLRQMGLKEAESVVSKRLGLKGRAVLSPFAELGMDVDKPFQLEILREYLSRIAAPDQDSEHAEHAA